MGRSIMKDLDNLSDEELRELLEQTRSLSRLPFIATPKQLDFIMAPETGLDKAVLYGGGIGSGKSWALCGAALLECLEVPNNRVLLVRRTSVDFKKTTLITLQQILPPNIIHRRVDQAFIFPNGSVLMYTGLGDEKDNQKIRGLEIGFLGIDEASEIDKTAFQIASSRLRWKPAMDADRIKVRLTSNPAPGWLKEDFIDNPKPGYRYIKSVLKDNPHVDYRYAEEQAALFADSPQWRQAFLEGDWNAFTGQDQILMSSLIKEAMDRNSPLGMPVTWGLDIARLGNDRSELYECAGTKFTQLQEWKKKTTDIVVRDVIARYRDAKIKPMMVNTDNIGVGGGPTDELLAAGLPVHGVNVNSSSRTPDRFANLKAELWWNLRYRMEHEPVDIPDDKELSAELSAMRYEYRTGRIYIPDKESIKKNLGRSPDKADALVLAAWRGAQSFVLYDGKVDKGQGLSTTSVLGSEPINPEADRTKMSLMRILGGR